MNLSGTAGVSRPPEPLFLVSKGLSIGFTPFFFDRYSERPRHRSSGPRFFRPLAIYFPFFFFFFERLCL